jgi:hypothetical protein
MNRSPEPPDIETLRRTADRLEELADTAELMGDTDGATRLRSVAWNRRLEAMALLDD